MTILIVDDDAAIRQIVTVFLEYKRPLSRFKYKSYTEALKRP
jgi:DNA-binding response OmpR family regulator